MILTDREIKIAVERGIITISPPPDPDTAFSSTAVDLTLDDSITLFNELSTSAIAEIDPGAAGFDSAEIIRTLSASRSIGKRGILLRPHVLALTWTAETIELEISTKLAARVEGKSSLARLGLAVHVTAPTIHAGFKGQIQLEMINHGTVPIRLRPGMRICQLIFEATLGTPERGYQGQFYGQNPALLRRRIATPGR